MYNILEEEEFNVGDTTNQCLHRTTGKWDFLSNNNNKCSSEVEPKSIVFSHFQSDATKFWLWLSYGSTSLSTTNGICSEFPATNLPNASLSESRCCPVPVRSCLIISKTDSISGVMPQVIIKTKSCLEILQANHKPIRGNGARGSLISHHKKTFFYLFLFQYYVGRPRTNIHVSFHKFFAQTIFSSCPFCSGFFVFFFFERKGEHVRMGP